VGEIMPHDVVTFGEAMLRLSPPHFQRIEQVHSLDVQIGGAELNTAVGLTRLGRATAWVSRLTRNSLGGLLANRAREAGVDVEHVVWTEEDRVGVYYVEFGAAPRASSVLYDRSDSAMARIHPGMVDWPAAFAEAKWFHVTGITPALSLTAAEATREALHAARAARLKTSIDLNYRAKLWSSAEAGKWMTQLLPLCDVLITTEEDAERVLGVRGTDHADVARQLAQRFPVEVVAITLRDNPLVWKNSWTAIAFRAGSLYKTRVYEVEIVDRLGAGDSFAAGLIDGLLDDDVQKGLDYGVAASALKHAIPGDFAWITREEVEAILQGPGLRINR
jgi:2-dehydro-3-deoxygluconokinase